MPHVFPVASAVASLRPSLSLRGVLALGLDTASRSSRRGPAPPSPVRALGRAGLRGVCVLVGTATAGGRWSKEQGAATAAGVPELRELLCWPCLAAWAGRSTRPLVPQCVPELGPGPAVSVPPSPPRSPCVGHPTLPRSPHPGVCFWSWSPGGHPVRISGPSLPPSLPHPPVQSAAPGLTPGRCFLQP